LFREGRKSVYIEAEEDLCGNTLNLCSLNVDLTDEDGDIEYCQNRKSS